MYYNVPYNSNQIVMLIQHQLFTVICNWVISLLLIIIIIIVEFALGESYNVIKSINFYNEKLKLPFFFHCYSVFSHWVALAKCFCVIRKENMKYYGIIKQAQQPKEDVILFSSFSNVHSMYDAQLCERVDFTQFDWNCLHENCIIIHFQYPEPDYSNCYLPTICLFSFFSLFKAKKYWILNVICNMILLFIVVIWKWKLEMSFWSWYLMTIYFMFANAYSEFDRKSKT